MVISHASLTVDEDDSEDADVATYTIKLATQPTAMVTVTPTSSDSTAATVSSAVSFTTSNWNNAKKITVTAVDDDIDNAGDSRSVTISHTAAGGDYATVTAPSVSVSVADDDTAAVVVSDTAVVAAENAGTSTYTMKLASQPTASVTVTPTSDTTTAATVSGALTFTTANWATEQSVTVTGVNAAVANSGGHRAATVSHTVAGGDYATISAPAVSAFVIDDDSTPTPAVCNHTLAVRDTIVASVSGETACADITWLDLAGVTELNLASQRMAALTSGDFDGLVDLRILRLNDTRLPQVPSGVFDKNTELRELWLGQNQLTTLPAKHLRQQHEARIAELRSEPADLARIRAL